MADYDAVILPGEEGKIRIVIEGSRIGPGNNKKSFTVTSNDPQSRKTTLSVAARVKQVFDVLGRLYFTGFMDEPLEIETEVTNLLDDPIRITGYRWSRASREREKYIDELEVTIGEIEKGKRYSLRIRKKGTIEPGHYSGELVLTTNSERIREKRIPIMLSINSIVSVNPSVVLYGEMKIGKGGKSIFERSFHIATMRGDSLKVLGVVPSREDIEVDIEELQPGRVYRGTVKVRPTIPTRRYLATIKIQTNYPGGEELELMLRGSVVEAGADR